MKRWQRVLLELLGPPALGALVFWFFAAGSMLVESLDGRRTVQLEELVQAWLLLTLYAYVFAGLQSVIYTLVLEWRFSRGLDPASWGTVAWSTVLGWMSGAAIIVVMGDGRAEWLAWLIWGGLGAVVGLLNGVLIRWLARRERASVPEEGDAGQ